jgi:LTXXQ motif family protein
MRWMQRGLVCIATVLAVPVAAQQGPGRGQARMQGPDPIEKLLQLERTLELSEDQIEQLTALQQEIEAIREARRAEATEFRQRVRDGEVTRNEIREWAEARRELVRGTRESRGERIDGILDEEQHARIEEVRQLGQRRGPAMGERRMRSQGQRGRAGVRGARGFSRGRGTAWRGRGMSRGFRSGHAFPGQMNRRFRRGRGGDLDRPPPS